MPAHAEPAELVPPVTAAGGWGTAKRAFDVLAASLMILAAVPILLVVAIAIRLDSRGPVIFRQRRFGRGGRAFTLLKFRTMARDASPDLHRSYIDQLARDDDDQEGLRKLTDDPRVTRVGALLRKTSLDELPQLVNVLAGRMSIVGPRPALEYELCHYDRDHFHRFQVRPGLTGLWQVSGRNELGFREMLDLDVEYAYTTGPRTDARILLRTPYAVVRGRAA